VDVVLFVIQGLVLVGAAVVIVSQHQAAIGHALGRFAPRSLRLRLGLSYPPARRFPTAMARRKFPPRRFLLLVVSVFSAMFASQIDKFTRETSGGFNVVTESNPTNPVSASRLAAVRGVRAVAPLATVTTQVTAAPGLTRPTPWQISGFDSTFVD